jgi:hypothetical protein
LEGHSQIILLVVELAQYVQLNFVYHQQIK